MSWVKWKRAFEQIYINHHPLPEAVNFFLTQQAQNIQSSEETLKKKEKLIL